MSLDAETLVTDSLPNGPKGGVQAALDTETLVADVDSDGDIPESQDVSEEKPDTPQGFRNEKVREIPSGPGVYALCDLDNIPLYVGQSVDGIQARVRRHLTSARSDIIANRMVDIWEVASVKCWEVTPTRTSFAKYRDSQLGIDPWNAETTQKVRQMTEQHRKELADHLVNLSPDLPTLERRRLLAELKTGQKDAVADYKRKRAAEWKKKKTAFEKENKNAWDATRKVETQKLKALTDPLEAYLYNEFNSQKPLMNAKALKGLPEKPSNIPEAKTVVVMQTEVCEMRRIESLRLSRQANHFSSLLDHILNVKNNHILRVALKAHYWRLSQYCNKFVGDGGEAAWQKVSSPSTQGVETHQTHVPDPVS